MVLKTRLEKKNDEMMEKIISEIKYCISNMQWVRV